MALVFTFASVARADLMVEPYLGYQVGTLFNTSGNTEYSSSTKGTLTGLRLGYLAPALLWVALDYQVGVAGKVSSSSVDVDNDRSNFFLDVGVNLPLIRAWAGYGFNNSVTIKPSGANSSNFSGGSMLKAGVGTTIFPFVSVNLEYVVGNYSSYPASSTAGKENMTILSVSLPLSF